MTWNLVDLIRSKVPAKELPVRERANEESLTRLNHLDDCGIRCGLLCLLLKRLVWFESINSHLLIFAGSENNLLTVHSHVENVKDGALMGVCAVDVLGGEHDSEV